MADAMLDARQEGGSYRRIEVITGQTAAATMDGRGEGPDRRGELRGRAPTFPRWLGAMASPVGCSRPGGTRFATAARGKAPSFVPVTIAC